MINLYNKYYGILKHIYNIMNLTDNKELKEVSKKTIINTINQLCEKDKNNKKAYESVLEEFGFVEKNVETSIAEKGNVLDNSQVHEDLAANNEEQYKNVDEYVFNKIYRNENKLLGDEFQNIMRNLINSIKNNDEENIILNKKKYDKFVNDNKDILDQDKMNEFFLARYNEYKIQNEQMNKDKNDTVEEDKKDENIKDTEEKQEKKAEEEPLKIKSVKRSFNSKLKNRALSLLALVGIGAFNPLVATGIGIGGYFLYKKGIKNAKSLIESNGLKLDDKDNLVDAKGKLINEEEIGKLKYNLVKRELSNVKNSGRINYNYKKNKLTSMLLSFPSKVFKNIKNKYEQIKISKENVSEELNDINKGLGIIK